MKIVATEETRLLVACIVFVFVSFWRGQLILPQVLCGPLCIHCLAGALQKALNVML